MATPTRRDDIARVVFQVSDVISYAEEQGVSLTGQQAYDWLERNRKYVEDAMLNAGWDAIDTLLSEDGLI